MVNWSPCSKVNNNNLQGLRPRNRLEVEAGSRLSRPAGPRTCRHPPQQSGLAAEIPTQKDTPKKTTQSVFFLGLPNKLFAFF